MDNNIIFQAFEWYLSDDGNYYKDMVNKLDDLAKIGVNAIWLPPIYKATGTNDVGYGVYDIYDLGEFDQKGSVRTKYGTKDELLTLVSEIHKREMKVFIDVVLNHKAGADYPEKFKAVMVDENDRTKDVSDIIEIEAWTGFEFKGRGDKYSDFKWNHNHFTGVDYDNLSETNAIYRIVGENKGWALGVSKEKSNYDYLMFADIDLAHPDVKAELKKWALWIIEELQVDGFRMDALKHMDSQFLKEFFEFIKAEKGDDFFIVGEYWLYDYDEVSEFLASMDYNLSILDSALHYNFFSAADQNYDLRTILDNSLVQKNPVYAVTFVDNHDTQVGEALESNVADSFKEIGYGIILLRSEGYPTIFYGDYYGVKGEPGIKAKIDKLATLRYHFAYGDQDDYFDDANCIGWVRHGNEEHPHKMVVIISNNEASEKDMFVGKSEANKQYTDYLGNNENQVVINEAGYGTFKVSENSISVYLEADLEL